MKLIIELDLTGKAFEEDRAAEVQKIMQQGVAAKAFYAVASSGGRARLRDSAGKLAGRIERTG